jgi:hypothetical protein
VSQRLPPIAKHYESSKHQRLIWTARFKCQSAGCIAELDSGGDETQPFPSDGTHSWVWGDEYVLLEGSKFEVVASIVGM